jgi:hypothetical protein
MNFRGIGRECVSWVQFKEPSSASIIHRPPDTDGEHGAAAEGTVYCSDTGMNRASSSCNRTRNSTFSGTEVIKHSAGTVTCTSAQKLKNENQESYNWIWCAHETRVGKSKCARSHHLLTCADAFPAHNGLKRGNALSSLFSTLISNTSSGRSKKIRRLWNWMGHISSWPTLIYVNLVDGHISRTKWNLSCISTWIVWYSRHDSNYIVSFVTDLLLSLFGFQLTLSSNFWQVFPNV